MENVQYTAEEIGRRIRERNPEAFKGMNFSDEQIGRRAIERNPELQKVAKPIASQPSEAPVETVKQPTPSPSQATQTGPDIQPSNGSGYSVEDIGRNIRSRDPQKFRLYSDRQIGEEALNKYPKLQSIVKRDTGSSGSIFQRPADQADQKKGLLEKASDASDSFFHGVIDLAVGAAKGAGTTALNLSEMGSKAMEAGYNATIGKITGRNAFKGAETAAQAKEAIKPTNMAQNVGFGAEQVAEFLIPETAVAKGAKAMEAVTAASKMSKFAKGAANLAGKVGMEAAATGAVTAAQGGGAKEIAENAALGGAGALAGKALGAAGKAMSKPLQESAEKGYAQAMGATTKANKEMTRTIVPELLNKNVSALSRASLLNKFSKKVDIAGKAMDDVLSGIPKDAPVNLNAVVDDLEKAKGAFMVKGANGKMVIADPQAVQHIEGFQNIIKEIGTENAPYESVRSLRQIWDKSVAKAGGYYGKTLAEGTLMDAKREAANALRKELASEFPDMAKVNADFSFWSKAHDVLSATVERTQSQRKPLTETVRRVAGAAIGSAAGGAVGGVVGDAVMGGLSKLVDSTAWKTIGSIKKSQIAKYLANGELEKAANYISKIVASRNTK